MSENMLLRWLVPICTGLVVIVVTILLRHYLYRNLHKWSQKKQKKWYEIIVKPTRNVSLVWCFVLGIYAGIEIAVVPPSWETWINDIIPMVFVILGFYTGVIICELFIGWYRVEIVPKTASSLDDTLMAVLRLMVPIVALVLGTFTILSMMSVKEPAFWAWMREHGPPLAIIFVLSLAFLLGGTVWLPRVFESWMQRTGDVKLAESRGKRVQTLSGLLLIIYQVIIIIVFSVMVLNELGVDTTILVAVTTVIGFALSLGIKELITDMIAGIFIVAEDQYEDGDWIQVTDGTGNYTQGQVKSLNLRRTVMRDLDGVVHTLPNGKIQVTSNYAKEISRVNLNLSVAYDTDLNYAIEVINRVGKEMAEDPAWAQDLLTVPEVKRVDKLGDSGIEIKITADTRPMRQFDVMGQLRLRMKNAFDAEGIEIPFPHTKVYFGNALPSV